MQTLIVSLYFKIDKAFKPSNVKTPLKQREARYFIPGYLAFGLGWINISFFIALGIAIGICSSSRTFKGTVPL